MINDLNFDEEIKTIKLNQDILDQSWYLTDIKIKTINEQSFLVARSYTKIPLIWRAISWIRFKLCTHSSTSDQIKNLVRSKHQSVHLHISNWLKIEDNENFITIKKVYDYYQLIDQLSKTFNQKDNFQNKLTLSEKHFESFFGSQSSNVNLLTEVENALSEGYLPSLEGINKVRILAKIYKQFSSFSSEQIKEICPKDLSKTNNLIENYNYLLSINEKLTTIDFFKYKVGCLHKLQKILAKIREDKTCSYRDIKTISDIRQAVKVIQNNNPLLFEKYYAKLSNLMRCTEPYLNEASVRIRYMFEIQLESSEKKFYIDQVPVNIQKFFDELIKESIEYPIQIINQLPTHTENDINFLKDMTCLLCQKYPNLIENKVSLFSRYDSLEMPLFLERIRKYQIFESITIT